MVLSGGGKLAKSTDSRTPPAPGTEPGYLHLTLSGRFPLPLQLGRSPPRGPLRSSCENRAAEVTGPASQPASLFPGGIHVPVLLKLSPDDSENNKLVCAKVTSRVSRVWAGSLLSQPGSGPKCTRIRLLCRKRWRQEDAHPMARLCQLLPGPLSAMENESIPTALLLGAQGSEAGPEGGAPGGLAKGKAALSFSGTCRPGIHSPVFKEQERAAGGAGTEHCQGHLSVPRALTALTEAGLLVAPPDRPWVEVHTAFPSSCHLRA